MAFNNTKFGLKLKSVVDVHKTSKDYKTARYYQIKDNVKVTYESEELDSEEIEFT
jgi:hypothetical protein